MNQWMKLAVNEGRKSVESGDGGPFGAVIVQNHQVIATGGNVVIRTNDPTMHAEIAAIRKASQILKRFELSDCEIYCTCEPCPMCLGAIYWARIPKVYYGCTRDDAAGIGFSDADIYKVIEGKEGKLTLEKYNIDREQCLEVFKVWSNKSDKRIY